MQMSHRSLSIVAILGLVGAAAAVGCVDVTPITEVPVAADAGAEAGAEASVSSLVATGACFECATGASEAGPSCGTEYAACAADPKCLSLFLCGLPRGCYAPGQDLVACLTTCGVAAGLTGADDPSVGPFLGVYLCATSTCAEGCASSSSTMP